MGFPPRLTVSLVFLALAVLPGPAAAADGATPETPSLSEILLRMSRVAELYAGNLLEFSCIERVRWVDYDSHGSPASDGKVRNNYVYSMSDDEDLEEIRAPNRVRSLEDAHGRMEKRSVRLYVSRAYFWALLFHESRRETFEFTRSATEPIRGQRTVRLDFRPVPPVIPDSNDWHGHVIVDLDTYQILRAEGRTHDDESVLRAMRELFESDAPLPASVDDRTFYAVTVTTEFGVKKNGMRLPSRVEVSKAQYRVRGAAGNRTVRETPVRWVKQTYKDYKFQRVWSTQQIRNVVFGATTPSSPP